MTRKVIIKNFKSVKQLVIPANKVNIFIGEPNTGKSNILEALSFFSPGSMEEPLFKEIFRFKNIGDFFFDNNYNQPVNIQTDSATLDLSLSKNANGGVYNEFEFVFYENNTPKTATQPLTFKYNFNGQKIGNGGFDFGTTFRSYIFKRLNSFSSTFKPFLNPPFGDNMPNLLLGNPDLRKLVSDFFREKGFRIQLKPGENDISISKEVNEEIYSYPFSSTSETLQRIVFMMLALESNKDATITFDEPESNTFPFYTKYIAERIALDESNQFFITTHNPYLLMSIIEKAKIEDLNIFVCQLKNYETKLTLLKPDQLKEALDLGSDIFFNLNRLVN